MLNHKTSSVFSYWKDCPQCGGTGIGVKKVTLKGKERHKWIDSGCPHCKGMGIVLKENAKS